MKNFLLIGAAGYIAPKHMRAIKDTGNNLLAALDKFDSVGIMDSYFPEADFFTEFERFDRYIEKLKFERHLNADYVSICTPNYLHDAHIRFALRREAHAICEKPLVLNPWNLDALAKIEAEGAVKIYTILQLRHHPSIIALKNLVAQSPETKIFDLNLKYITSRGHWYHYSWKGDLAKSGGVATNIGVHFFDMLSWIFGPATDIQIEQHNRKTAKGYLAFKKARVNWFLSIDYDSLPEYVKEKGQRTYRSLRIEGQELEFSAGFTDLHTLSYREILNGRGYGLEDTRQAIEIVYKIRNGLTYS